MLPLTASRVVTGSGVLKSSVQSTFSRESARLTVPGLVQMIVVDLEIDRAIGQPRLAAQGDGEIIDLGLHRNADSIHRQVGQHRHLEGQIGAGLPPVCLGIDAEAGGIAQRLHVDQGHDVGHGAIHMHAELPDRASEMKIGDQRRAPADGQRADTAAGEIGPEGVAGQDGVARHLGGVGQAASRNCLRHSSSPKVSFSESSGKMSWSSMPGGKLISASSGPISPAKILASIQLPRAAAPPAAANSAEAGAPAWRECAPWPPGPGAPLSFRVSVPAASSAKPGAVTLEFGDVELARPGQIIGLRASAIW